MLLAVACAALLAAGVAWRWPTVLHLGDYRASLAGLGYTDIDQLYLLRNFAAHQIPYLQQEVEYPVLTGFTMWVTSYVPGGVNGYFLLNGTILGLAGLATLFVLRQFVSPGQLARYAFAPGLVLYVALNWDMLSLLALAGGLLWATRRQFIWCGLCLAVGASYKLYPAFVLPALFGLTLALDRKRVPADGRYRHTAALAASFAVATLAFNLPVAVRTPAGWSYFLTFQETRPIDPDAIWFHLPPVPVDAINRAFAASFVLVVVWLAVRVFSNRGEGWQYAAAASLLAFLLTTRDYSPQYDVWLLPLFAVVALPWRWWTAFVLADLLYYASIFLFIYPGFGWPSALSNPPLTLGITVWFRELVSLALFGWLVSRLRSAGATTGRTSPFPSARIAIWAGVLCVAATLVSVANGMRMLAFDWRMVTLGAEAIVLAMAVAAGEYLSIEGRWRDGQILARLALIPLAAETVLNFSTIGSYLVPGLILAAVAATEGWWWEREGYLRERIGSESSDARA